MNMKSQITLGVLSLFTVLSSSATVLLTENFGYSNGGLVANSGGNWTNLSGTGTFLQVTNGEVAGIAHGSGSREDAVRVFTASPIGTEVYASFNFTVTTAPTAVQDYFFAFTDDLSNFRGRVFLAAPSAANANEFRIGISNVTTTAANIVFSNNLLINTTYSIIVRGGADAVINSAVWVGTNASAFDSATPSITASDAYGLETLSRVAIRQGNTITTANSLNFDNLVVGTTFSDVSVAILDPNNGAIPEPSSYAAIFGVFALAGAALRRRSRK